MGLTLLESNDTFRESIVACGTAIQRYGVDLLAEFRSECGWNSPLLGAVGLLAIQIGLVDLLREKYGVTPSGMIGHSAGMPLLWASCSISLIADSLNSCSLDQADLMDASFILDV